VRDEVYCFLIIIHLICRRKAAAERKALAVKAFRQRHAINHLGYLFIAPAFASNSAWQNNLNHHKQLFSLVEIQQMKIFRGND